MNISTLNYQQKKTNLKGFSKILHILLFFIAISISTVGMAQTKKEETNVKKPDSIKVKQENFMDMGAATLGQIFGENLDGQSKSKKLSFLEMLEKMEMPAEQKAEYKNWYFLQATDLTEKQKDSLGIAIEKKIMEAQNNPENH